MKFNVRFCAGFLILSLSMIAASRLDAFEPAKVRALYFRDDAPVEAGCDCYACRHFSRGAIRHFFFAGEMLGPVLASVHNVRFYQRLMSDLGRAISQGVFEEFRRTDPRCRLGPREAPEEASCKPEM